MPKANVGDLNMETDSDSEHKTVKKSGKKIRRYDNLRNAYRLDILTLQPLY